MLIPFAFAMLFLRLVVNLVGYVRLFLNSNATPVAVPLIADVRELAKGEAAEAGVIAVDDDGTERRTGA